MFDTLRNAQGEALESDLHGYLTPGCELAVIGHGVTGNKDRAWAVELAATLAASGIPTLRFSFSGNGGSEGEFADSCPTKEVGDLNAVLEAAVQDGRRPITYIGHSMGAAVGVLAAHQNARITRLVSLAGMVHTADFYKAKFSKQRVGKTVMWDKPECPLSATFRDDMNAIGSVLPLASKLSQPWLLVHGTEDTVVPDSESIEVMRAARGTAELVRLGGVDHVFSGEGTAQMCEAVLRYLTRSWCGATQRV